MQIGVKPDEQTKLYEEIAKLTGWEREQTNKEWIQSATTEQLAALLTDIQADGYYKTYCMNYEERLAWLKEIHE